jgi:hypothetical protein
MRALEIVILMFLIKPVLAGEQKLRGDEITAVLSDVVLSGNNGVTQIFQKSGATFYSQNGSQSQGSWKVTGDKYCSQWPPNETWPCFDVLRDGELITFVSSSGTRYEMHLTKP